MKYLSDEWFAEANNLVSGTTTQATFCLGTRVVSDSAATEYLCQLGSGVEFSKESIENCEVVIEYTAETAQNLNGGGNTIREAILAKDVIVTGDTVLLAEASDDLAKVAEALQPLQTQTDY